MYYYQIDIPLKKSRPEYISIIPIGDIHLANPYSNLTRATEFRDYVLATPNTYTIDMGDDMDIVTKESKGNIYDQQYSPYYQKQEAVKFWRPVHEAGKLLCVMDDNHSYRARELADWRIVLDMCNELKTRYGGWGAFLDLRIGKQQYTIYVVHGKKCGTTDAYALNSVITMNQRCIADIYLRGHHHRKIVHQDEIKKLVFRSNEWKLAEHKRTYAVTGSFLEWDNSYAEQLEYNITVKGCIKLKLFTKKWDVHTSLTWLLFFTFLFKCII